MFRIPFHGDTRSEFKIREPFNLHGLKFNILMLLYLINVTLGEVVALDEGDVEHGSVNGIYFSSTDPEGVWKVVFEFDSDAQGHGYLRGAYWNETYIWATCSRTDIPLKICK